MCLIPTSVVQSSTGLPFFIKWDDSGTVCAPRGRRRADRLLPRNRRVARAVGGRDDSLDWRAYFHERNRLVAALIHSVQAQEGTSVAESMQGLRSEASVVLPVLGVELRLKALEDVFTRSATSRPASPPSCRR